MNMVTASDKLRKCKTRNQTSWTTTCIFGMMLIMSISLFGMTAFAESSQTTVTRLDDEISLEKTVISMNIPEDNTFPWGTIKGKVNEPAQGYPVIIQIFKSLEDDPIHVAQVSLKGDNSFEYKFRLLSIDEDKVTHFFEGNYFVKIFKVIDTPRDDLETV